MTSGNIDIKPRSKRQINDFEIVERKGTGHPDTMSDELAVRLSRRYSKYTRSEFGAILHHNFDKVGLLGGESRVELGAGELMSPIRVLLNGRASAQFGDEEIPVRALLVETAKDFLSERLPIDPEKDLKFHYNVSTASSPGGVNSDFEEENLRDYWFSPRSLDDLQERHKLVSNDTSHGVGYAPLGATGKFVRALEEHLTGAFRVDNPWLGTDVKLMATRRDDHITLTGAIPQIADEVPNVEAYKQNLRKTEREIDEFASDLIPDHDLTIHTNTRTDYETGQMYLTAIGSAIESGDEGLVGRGNRSNGLITPTNPMSIEGQCGKNPVYHIGMIYNVGARRVAQRVHKKTGSYVEAHLISQSGRELVDPWHTIVDIYGADYDEEAVENAIVEELQRIPEITDDWLAGDVRLF